MPDGSPLTIGQVGDPNNTSSTPTRLIKDATQSGGSALLAENVAASSAATGDPVGVYGICPQGWGVVGSGKGPGVYGSSTDNAGAIGRSESRKGDPGVSGSSATGPGVLGASSDPRGLSAGVSGISDNFNYGVAGISTNNAGVYGTSAHNNGVYATSENASGVFARSNNGDGIVGVSNNAYGVFAETSTDNSAYAALFAFNTASLGRAGYFIGAVYIQGDLLVTGDKKFRIDHPLDPANKYLDHVAVESSQRKNIYDGVVELDEEGAAWVTLPEYFEALNRDFRYQLTPIGAPAPALHIAVEVSENRFKIAGGQQGMKVSWQITGIRNDRWAEANPLEIEQEKEDQERGRYMHPELYGEPEERGIHFHRRPLEDRVKEEREHAEELRRRMEELRQRMEEVPPLPPEAP